MTAVSVVDTNVLVYRFDPRDERKQDVATRLLRDGMRERTLVLPHQAVIEFVAAVIRPRGGEPMLERDIAIVEAERVMRLFPVLYPNHATVETALRGFATYGLSWFDAHLWAYAETNGIREIVSEDFEHGRHYGNVRIRNPFLEESGVHEPLPPLYG